MQAFDVSFNLQHNVWTQRVSLLCSLGQIRGFHNRLDMILALLAHRFVTFLGFAHISADFRCSSDVLIYFAFAVLSHLDDTMLRWTGQIDAFELGEHLKAFFGVVEV